MELLAGEEKRMTVGMPPGNDQPNWFYVVVLDGGGDNGAQVELSEPLPSKSSLRPRPLRRKDLLRRVQHEHREYMGAAVKVGAGSGFRVHAGEESGALWACVIPRTAQVQLELELEAETQAEPELQSQKQQEQQQQKQQRQQRQQEQLQQQEQQQYEEQRQQEVDAPTQAAPSTAADNTQTDEEDEAIGGFSITLTVSAERFVTLEGETGG